MVLFNAAGKVVEGLKTNAWDVAFVAIDPARAVDIDFSPPYVIIEGSYLVPQASPITNNAEVDREGGYSSEAAAGDRIDERAVDVDLSEPTII